MGVMEKKMTELTNEELARSIRMAHRSHNLTCRADEYNAMWAELLSRIPKGAAVSASPQPPKLMISRGGEIHEWCPDCRGDCCSPYKPKPISGGASTGEQPPTSEMAETLSRIAAQPSTECHFGASHPSGPSAKLCDFPFTEKCSQFEACVRANRCLKNLPEPSAPKVEPLISDYGPQDEATETASAPTLTEAVHKAYQDVLGDKIPYIKGQMDHSVNKAAYELWCVIAELERIAAATSVAGTQPTPLCPHCDPEDTEYQKQACRCAAQGTPQVEALAEDIVFHFGVQGNPLNLEAMREFLKSHLPGAPAQPGPEEKR